MNVMATKANGSTVGEHESGSLTDTVGVCILGNNMPHFRKTKCCPMQMQLHNTIQQQICMSGHAQVDNQVLKLGSLKNWH